MRHRRTARAAVSSAVVLVVAATTTLTLVAIGPDGAPWAEDREASPTVTAEPTDRRTHVSRSTDRGPALPVGLVVDGVEREVVTTASDVTALLVEQGVVLGDRAVSHDLDAPVVSGMRVEVVDVAWSHETLEVDLEPEIEEVDDATLAAGTRRVVSKGTPGRSVTTYLVASVDGVEASRAEVVSVILRDATPGKVLVGTGAAPTQTPTASPTTPAPRPTTPPSQPSEPDGAEPDGGEPDDASSEPAADPAPTTPAPTPTSAPTTAPPGTDGTTPASAKALAKRKVAARGWSSTEYRCLVKLWQRESGWSYTAANPTSTARGIPQAMMSIHFGADWRTSEAGRRYLTTPSVQIDWGLRYIAGRHDTPCGALKYSDAHGSY